VLCIRLSAGRLQGQTIPTVNTEFINTNLASLQREEMIMKRWHFVPGILAVLVGTYFFFIGGSSTLPPQTPTYGVDDSSSSFRRFAVPGIATTLAKSSVVDHILLSDIPGNWFKSDNLGIPISVIHKDETVEFDLKSITDVSHTVTLLTKPTGSSLDIDQDRADDDDVRVRFNEPGVYLFACKVHPYMMGVVVVLDEDQVLTDIAVPGEVTVSAAQLPFIDRLGAAALDAQLVANILGVLAPFDGATPSPFSDLGLILGKTEKWDIAGIDDNDPPVIPGVGEVWINAQFEAVSGQEDTIGNPKPGTIIVLDASDFTEKNKIDGVDSLGSPDPGIEVNGDNGWNNPHNMWINARHDTIYNGNWFGQWLNRINRSTGAIEETVDVGDGPTHIVTIPGDGTLTLPLSAEQDILKISDDGSEFDIEDSIETGAGNNHPHGQWISADGSKIVIPNVFQGEGLGGSVTIMDADSGDIIREIMSTDADGGFLHLPVAASIRGNDRAYVASIASGMVSVIDLTLDPPEIINNIRVACFNPAIATDTGDHTGTCLGAEDPIDPGGSVLHSLKLPIQTPASPDGKWVVTAVASLASGVTPDTVAVIDADADGGRGALVAELQCPAGCHGVNWGAKAGGGYYAYVTSQHSNRLMIVDPDPDGNPATYDAANAGHVVLSSPGDGPTVGTGGQGILPIPLVKDGWIQDAMDEYFAGNSDVNDFIQDLTCAQAKVDPSDTSKCTAAGYVAAP